MLKAREAGKDELPLLVICYKSFAMFLFILGEKVVVLLGKHQMRAVLLSRKKQHQSVTLKLFH